MLGFIFFKLGSRRRRCCSGSCSGPLMEENLRRAMLLSRGDWGTFATRPLSSGLLIAAALLIVLVALPTGQASKREVAFQED